MRYFQLLLLFGVAYLAIVAAEEDPSDNEEPENEEPEDEDPENEDEVNAINTGSVCQCSREYKPVCGSDGVTYNNKCLYECENAQRVENGKKELTIKCPAPCNQCTEPEACACTREYRPVCGSDGVTYSNKCLYECENKQRKLDGRKEITIRCPAACNQCPKTNPCICTKEYKPVCGSDGNTYGNTCQFNCENERRKNAGEPQIVARCKNVCSKCPPECVCPAIYAPVCGDDNKTYSNGCVVRCQNESRKREGKKPITVVCDRACDQCNSECVCGLNYLPVCGSDGKTYGNACQLRCENLRRKKAGQPEIVIRCQNSCDSCPPECACPLNYLPVCGSNGVTYSNECAFNCENERRRSQGQPSICISCNTSCDSCAVPAAQESAVAYAYA